MRAWLWYLVVWVFEREFTAACVASEEAGYDAGYQAARVPEGAFQEEFEKGYKAAEYDFGSQSQWR